MIFGFDGDSMLEVVEHFSYICIMFSSTGTFSGTRQDLAGGCEHYFQFRVSLMN